MRVVLVLVASGLSAFLSGCVVVPVGDLLRGPALEEQVLVQGDGLFSTDKIAIIDVDGVITGSEFSSVLYTQENTVSEVKARLVRARNDAQVQAVVLRISSPGGEVSACDTIHHEILEFKKALKIPIVAAIVNEGASGGYYVATAADLIVSHPTAIVGSIGVILQTFNIAGLLEKIGVETSPIKSAEKKDLLSPFRPRTPDEKAILQRMVDDLYRRFVDVVAARPSGSLTRDEVLKLADGSIYSGTNAETVKLVDRTGYLADAIEEARRLAKIERRPTLIRYSRPARSGANIYSLLGVEANPERQGRLHLDLSADLFPRARFLYLWQPFAGN